MRWAIIENHIVKNVVVADEETAIRRGLILCPDFAGPGWGYVDGTFTEPLPTEIVQAASPSKEDLLAQIKALQQQIEGLN